MLMPVFRNSVVMRLTSNDYWVRSHQGTCGGGDQSSPGFRRVLLTLVSHNRDWAASVKLVSVKCQLAFWADRFAFRPQLHGRKSFSASPLLASYGYYTS